MFPARRAFHQVAPKTAEIIDFPGSTICSAAFLKRVQEASEGYRDKETLMAAVRGSSAGIADYMLLLAYEQTKQGIFAQLRKDLWDELPNRLSHCSPNMFPSLHRR